MATAIAVLAAAAPQSACESTDDVVYADASPEGPTEGTATAPDAPAPSDAGPSDVSPPDSVASGLASRDASAPDSDAAMGVDAFVSTATMAQVRVANWSPDAPPVDFCLAQRGTGDFRGPFVAGLAAMEAEAGSPSDAAAAGLSYPNASAYALVPPGSYDARIVVGGGCSAKIAPDETSLPPLAAGTSATIALVGDANPAATTAALTVAGFVDDGPLAGSLAVRFIHAAPGVPSVDVGTVSGSVFKVLFSNIPFGQASKGALAPTTADGSVPTVDANGYLAQPALAGAVLRAQPHGGSDGGDVANAPGVYAAVGSAVSFVVVGAVPGVPLGLLECVDNAGTVGPLSLCTVISQ